MNFQMYYLTKQLKKMLKHVIIFFYFFYYDAKLQLLIIV